MSKFDNSIDSQIFMALTVSQKSQIPILILGNSGCGKSSVVKEFCDINGYKSVLLRISNETPDTLTGFPTVNGEQSTESRAIAAQHVRPDWFQEILDNKEKGFTSVLFLDEITTSNVMVQGAALNLVFDRRCSGEYLPEDTLIVAAGNYFGNLSNENTIIPPMLNRFCIINILPKESDLDTFLCKYDGAQSGRMISMDDELKRTWDSLQARKKSLSKDFISKAGEIIENDIKLECKQLIKEGLLNLEISDYQDIYVDQESNRLGNFISLRSLGYLRDMSLTFYECFGIEGMESDNFLNIVHGLAGIALGYDPKQKNSNIVVKNIVSLRLQEALLRAGQEIERLNNNKLPEYLQFFGSTLPKENGPLDPGILSTLRNKLEEMRKDSSLADIKTPLDMNLIHEILGDLKITLEEGVLKRYSNIVKGEEDNITELALRIKPEDYIADVELWNKIAQVGQEILTIVMDDIKGYDLMKRQSVNDQIAVLNNKSYRIRMIRRNKKKTDQAFFNMIPTLEEISVKSK